MIDQRISGRGISIIGLVQVAAIFTLILSVVTLFDQYHYYLELFSHFRAQYLIASIIFAVLLLSFKNYKYSFVLSLVVLLNSIYIVPWYLSGDSNVFGSGAADITLLHSNVHTQNDEFAAFVDLVLEENPDIFIVQEISQRWLAEINELEKVYTYKYAIPREDNFGIAIYSKYPYESVQDVYLGGSGLPSIVATVIISGQRVTIITTHPLPPVNNNSYVSRNTQIIEITEASKDHQGPLIIIGDLNVTMWSKDYETLEVGSNLTNARRGFGVLPTWPTTLPMFMIPIDHCLVSSHFLVQDIRVGEDIGSDHLPLIVKLNLKG